MITTKLTPAQYQQVGQKLTHDEGLTLTGNAGTLHKLGVAASYNYDGQQLTVKVLSHPFLLTLEACENQIAAALRQQGLVCVQHG